MKIMTKSPIIVDGMRYSSLDGSSSKDEIKAFQNWVYYVKKDPSIATRKQRDGVDGIFGKRTAAAWTKYGDEYTKLVEAAMPKPITPASTEQPAPTPTPEPTTTTTVTEQQKEGWWKRQSKLNKTLIIGGVALAIGLAFYYKTRKNGGITKKSKK